MAEVKSFSAKDLLLLITGFYGLKSPPQQANSGQAYWLNQDFTLRESIPTQKWLDSPQKAWENVRFRDWLLTALFGAMAGHTNDFVAISEPVLASIDVLGKEFTKDMKGLSESIIAALKTKTGFGRTLFNTLSFGISKHNVNGKEVFMFGAGMRRRARFWKTESLAIQADVEIYVPFYELPNSEPARDPRPTHSINAGIALSYSDGSPIGKDGDNDLIAVRFNVRSPFGTRYVPDPKSNIYYQLETSFNPPLIQIQKRTRVNAESPTSSWENFTGWKKFIESFSESPEGKELLNVPIGPLLLEKISGPAGLEDIFLWQSKKDIKDDLAKSQKEFQDTIKLLDNMYKIKSPEKEGAEPASGEHKLGHMLAALGFMEANDSSYKFKITEKLTVWDVVNRLFAELDGYPVYLKGTNPKNDKAARVAISLASTADADPNKSYFGLAGAIYNIPLKTVPPDTPPKKDKEKSYDEIVQIIVDQNNFARDRRIFWDDEEEEAFELEHRLKPDKEEEKSKVEVFLHLGKWFSDETLDDNWYRRLLPVSDSQPDPRVPVPGIRILPFKRVSKPPVLGYQEAAFTWSLRAELLSLGIDIKSATKKGFTFLKGTAGYFGLGALEIRLALSISADDINVGKEWWERFVLGVGIKLKDLSLSFAPKKEEKKAKNDDLLWGLQDILDDKPEEQKVKTRLSAKKKDKFSLSFGYLTQLTADSKGTLDVQLYDEKGNRGKMAFIEIDRSKGPFYLRRIGIALEGIENLELANGLPDTARLTVAITAGLRFQVFELGVINGKIKFQLNDPSVFTWGFDGLDVSVKISKLVISGSFFRSGVEWAGMLTCDFPKASFSAMGFYGSVRLAAIDQTTASIAELNQGKLPKELEEKLGKKKIKPAASTPIKPGSGKNEWELYSTDNTRYPILVTNDDKKLNVVSDDKTFFVYAMLNAAAGCGPTFGPIQFTGIAFGYGYNRRLKVPRIEEVADFPMVKMVMGEGGYQKDDKSLDIRNQLGKALEDPVAMLEKMKGSVVGEAGQQFACFGLRFTIGGIVDCFALGVVQWGDALEISLLGLARFRHPRDPETAPICYVEMQLLMSVKPDDGVFQLQALLTSNSWIINKDCKLTGGFALFIWFGGKHKGDWVVTFGGYHPRFVRPSHYPVVPRVGLNWRVNSNLTMKGSMYLAITPSCGMLGARMEATFHSGRVSAWFTAFLDVIVNWQPLYFEADIGISLRVAVSLWITSLKVTIGASIRLWGPPVGGIAHIDLAVISFDINFGEKPKQPELVSSWEQFCNNFLNLSGKETRPVNTPVAAPPVVQPTLASGRNNLSNLPNCRREQPKEKRDDDVWIVRADELELAADTVIPVSNVNVGTVNTNRSAEGVVSSSFSGQSLMVNEPLVISKPLAPKGRKLLRNNQAVGAHPMGKSLDSVLNVTVIQDEVSASTFELSGWTMEEEISALPAAVWDPAKPNLRPSEPSAKLIEGCITGIKKLKPPRGQIGKKAVPEITRHRLPALSVPWSATSQEIPPATVNRDIQPVVIAKHDNQEKVAAALTAAGFALRWQAAPVAEVRFRELQADPLGGAVAT
jgi:hypothetical protein